MLCAYNFLLQLIKKFKYRFNQCGTGGIIAEPLQGGQVGQVSVMGIETD